jgi:hypothetical protein
MEHHAEHAVKDHQADGQYETSATKPALGNLILQVN